LQQQQQQQQQQQPAAGVSCLQKQTLDVIKSTNIL